MASTRTNSRIAARELGERIAASESIQLIDVSTDAEYRAAHVACAQNVPFKSAELEALMKDRARGNSAPLYVMCAGGVRSKMVCAGFPAAGLVNVDGGTKQWIKDALPVVGDGAPAAPHPIRTIAATIAPYVTRFRLSFSRSAAN